VVSCGRSLRFGCHGAECVIVPRKYPASRLGESGAGLRIGGTGLIAPSVVKRHILQHRDLPSLPEVAVRVLEIVDNPRASASELSRAISLDPALTARVLRLANSALYGFTRRIGSTVQAVTVLGFSQVRSVVLTISILDIFSRQGRERIIPHRRIWEHSLACAVAARLLASRARLCPPEEAFVTGLLHDLGKIVLAAALPGEYQQALIRATAEQRRLVDAEMVVLNVSHAEVGRWVAEKWQLPQLLCEAIASHHRWQEELSGLARCLYAANVLVSTSQFGWTGNGRPVPLLDDVRQALSLDERATAALSTELAGQYAAAKQLLALPV
jgi:putative nucleotidyltransferase with HDIG domain